MGWDGNGNFTRERNFSADASAGINILASAMDQELNDFASALENTLTRDGQNAPTANIPMGGNRLVNVAAAASATDYMRGREFITNVPIYMIDAESSADNISVSAEFFTTVSATQAPIGGTRVLIKMGSDKGSAPAFHLNAGFGNEHSANVVLNNGSALYSGSLLSGGIYELIYDSADTVWKLANPTFLTPPSEARFAATTAAPGFIEIATTAEAQAGTNTTKAVTPATMADKFSADAATTASAGLIELATTAEVASGSSNSLAVTPSTLHAYVSVATTASAGLLEIATTAEVNSATDASRAVTPSTLPKDYIAIVDCAGTTADTTTVALNTLASAWTLNKTGTGTYLLNHGLELSADVLLFQVTQQANTATGRAEILMLGSADTSTALLVFVNGSGDGSLVDGSSRAHIFARRIV